MSEKYKTFPGGLFFVTLTLVGWIDLFTRYDYCDELINNLNFCIDKKGLRVFSFCIMPSHVHMVATLQDEQKQLSDVLRDFKSFSAKQFLKMINEHPQESRKEWLLHMFAYFAKHNGHNSQYQIWQQHNHPIHLFSNEWVEEKVNYIHQNPVKACLVTEPEAYVYSSANPFTKIKLEAL